MICIAGAACARSIWARRTSNLAAQYAGYGPAYGYGGFAPGWAWDPYLYSYDWIPGGGPFFSPFGFGFYSPYYLYGGGFVYGRGFYGRGSGYRGGYGFVASELLTVEQRSRVAVSMAAALVSRAVAAASTAVVAEEVIGNTKQEIDRKAGVRETSASPLCLQPLS